MDTVFMKENISNVANWLGVKSQTDDFDRETIRKVIMSIYNLAIKEKAPDRAMNLIYVLLKYIAPISGQLADRLEVMGLTLPQFISQLTGSSKDPKAMLALVQALLEAKQSENPTVVAGMSFFQRLIQFFKRLIASIRAIFSGGKA